MGTESPTFHNEKPIPHTDIPQPRPHEELKGEAELKAKKNSFANLNVNLGLSEDPQFFDKLKQKFASDYDTCFQIAKNIAENVSPELQTEYYSAVRSVLTFHPRAEELTYAMNLAWLDFHYHEEPSKLISALDLLQRKDLPPKSEKLSLVLSLLQSGYTSENNVKIIEQALDEILLRRKEFEERTIVGNGVSLISLEDSSNFSPRPFTNLAQKLGSEPTLINEKTATSLSESFYSAISKSRPNIPLTLTLTIHGMAQEGGYIALPNNERITPQKFAEALKKRGDAKNVTILTTQCFPRSSRAEDSFYDNLRNACLAQNIGIPMIYMESMENQPAVLNPKTNPESNTFQTLGIAARQAKDKKNITGADILRASEGVLGNQPSLILPPSLQSAIPLNNDLAFRERGKAENGLA